MMVDIAIIGNGCHLTALGLKSLIHEIAPTLSIGIFNNEEEADNACADEDVLTFCFKATNTVKAILVDPSHNEALLKKQLKSALKKIRKHKELGKNESASANRQLSSRETDVLRLVASGYINKEIADKLNISLQTVLTHRKHISEKLGIKTTSGFTAYAMINGLV